MNRDRTLGGVRLATLGALMLIAGCSGSESSIEAGRGAGLEAAIVPGADLVLRVDYRSLQESALVQELSGDETEAAPVPTDKWAKFVETTGITAESLQGLLLSVDLDSVDVASGAGHEEQLDDVAAVFGVGLDAPLRLEDIVSGANAASEGDGTVDASLENVEGTEMVKITTSEQGKTRTAYCAVSRSGETAYFAMNPPSLKGAIDRQASGNMETLSPALVSAESGLPPATQVRLAFLAPESWRTKIREQMESPEAGMLSGVLGAFSSLQSIAFGMGFDAEMTAQLVGDLGNEAAAQQISSMFQLMVLPMLRSAASGDSDAPDLAEKLAVAVEGNVVRVDLRLSASELAAFQEKASSMAATAGGGLE